MELNGVPDVWTHPGVPQVTNPGAPLPSGNEAVPMPGDKAALQSGRRSAAVIPLLDEGDQVVQMDRSLWTALAEVVGLKELDGLPVAALSDVQIRRAVLVRLDLAEQATLPEVQSKVKALVETAAQDHALFARQFSFKEARLRGATQIYRELYYAGHKLEVADRLQDLQRVHRQLSMARESLAKLGQVVEKLFPVTDLVKPGLDIAVHPPKLPPGPPDSVAAAMEWERKQPPRPAKDPFQSALWDKAKGVLTNRDRDEGHPLTVGEWEQLIAEACRDGLVTPEERVLLLHIWSLDNAKVLEAAAKSGKRVSLSQLKAVDPDQPYSGGKSLGAWLDDKLDQTLSARQIGGATAKPKAIMRKEAAAARIGPGQSLHLASREGRWKILDWLSQLPQRDGVGENSCVATSMVALAVNEGETGLRHLCQALLRDNPASEPAARLLGKFSNGKLTVKDLEDLAESLYRTLDASEAHKPRGKLGGILSDTTEGFLKRHQDLLHVLFASGGSLVSLDTDGDASVNHMVAFIPGPGGQEMVFEPSGDDWGHDRSALGWPEDAGRVTPHHLLNGAGTVLRYRLAANRFFMVLDPQVVKLAKG